MDNLLIIIYVVGVLVAVILCGISQKQTDIGREGVFDYFMFYLFLPALSWLTVCIIIPYIVQHKKRYG